jgi:hypothetical protein
MSKSNGSPPVRLVVSLWARLLLDRRHGLVAGVYQHLDVRLLDEVVGLQQVDGAMAAGRCLKSAL